MKLAQITWSNSTEAHAQHDHAQQLSMKRALVNAVCLVNKSDHDAFFVVLPKIPPGNVIWNTNVTCLHLGSMSFQKCYQHKLRTGNSDSVYQKRMMKALDIARLKTET